MSSTFQELLKKGQCYKLRNKVVSLPFFVILLLSSSCTYFDEVFVHFWTVVICVYVCSAVEICCWWRRKTSFFLSCCFRANVETSVLLCFFEGSWLRVWSCVATSSRVTLIIWIVFKALLAVVVRNDCKLFICFKVILKIIWQNPIFGLLSI